MQNGMMMRRETRLALLTGGMLLAGGILLYQPVYHFLHGVALACWLIGALFLLHLSPRSSLVLGGLFLVTGTAFLCWPAGSLLRGSATHLLLSGGLLFAAAAPWKRPVGWGGVGLMVLSALALYGAFGGALQARALLLLLVGTLAFSLAFPYKAWVERSAIGLVAVGLIFLGQPFALALYRTGFQFLLAGTLAFVVASHRG